MEAYVVIFMCLVASLAFLFNLLVVTAVLGSPHLRTAWNNCFFLNLCLTGMLAALLVMPFSMVAYVRKSEEISPAMCVSGHFVQACVVNVTVWTTCLISIDRHYLILMPMVHAAEVTLFRTLLALVVVWIVSVLPAGYLIFTKQGADFEVPLCCTWGLGVSSSSTGYVLTVLVLEFLLPATITTSMYGSIYRVARRAVRSVKPSPCVSTVSASVASREAGGEMWDSVAWTASVTPSPSSSFSTPTSSSQLSVIQVSQAIRTKPKKKKETCRGPVGGRSAGTLGQSTKAVRTLLMVVGTFWLLYAPYYIFNTYLALAYLGKNTNSSSNEAAAAVLEESLGLLQRLMSKASTKARVNVKAADLQLLQTALTAQVNNKSSNCLGVDDEGQHLETWAHLTEWLLYITFAVNPFLYGVLNRAIRSQLCRMTYRLWGWHLHCSYRGSRSITRRKKTSNAPVGGCVMEESIEAGLENILEFLERTNRWEPYTLSMTQLKAKTQDNQILPKTHELTLVDNSCVQQQSL